MANEILNLLTFSMGYSEIITDIGTPSKKKKVPKLV